MYALLRRVMPPRRRTTRKSGGGEAQNGELQIKGEAASTAALTAAPTAAQHGNSAGKKKNSRRTNTEAVSSGEGKVPRLDPAQIEDQDATKSKEKQKPNGRKRRSPQNSQENKNLKKLKQIKKEDIDSTESIVKTSRKTNRRKTSKISKSNGSSSPKDEGPPLNDKSPEISDTDDSDFEEVDSGGNVPLSVHDRSLPVKTDNLEKIGTKLSSESGESDFEEVASTSFNKAKSRNTKRNKKAVAKSKGSQNRKKRVKTGETKGINKSKADSREQDQVSLPIVSTLDEDDVTAVLLHMEGSTCSLPSTSEGQGQRGSEVKGSSLSDDSDGSEDWEEVEETDGRALLSRVPTEPVEITLEAPDFLNKKRKKKQFDWHGYVQRTMRRFQKDVQINMHKVHLLCLLAHGFRQNFECNREILKALALSILPSHWSITSLSDLKNFLKWFHHEFPLLTTSTYFDRPEDPSGVVTCESLQTLLSDKQISSGRTLVIIFIILLRCLGIDVRLVMSFQPMKMKLAESDKFNVKQKSRHKADKSPHKHDKKKKSKCASSGETSTRKKTGSDSNKQKQSKSAGNKGKSKSCKEEELSTQEDSDEVIVKKEKQMKNKNNKLKIKKEKRISKEENSEDDIDTKIQVKQEDKVRDCKPQCKKGGKGRQLYKEMASSDEEDERKGRRSLRARDSRRSNQQEEEESGEEFVVEKKISKGKSLKRSEQKGGRKSEKLKRKVKKERDVSSESEFEDCETQFRSPLQEKLKRNRKVLSSDSEKSDTVHGSDTWTEVYLSGEDRWVCVDCVNNIVDKPYEVEGEATQPLHYVLAYTAAGYVSDVTARYASQWMSQTRKLRVDADWWRETLESYRSPLAEQAEKDEETIKDQLLRRPLPTSVGEFKSHPLYALPRHLLKFEAIYPTTAAPFGYIRGEPIYARECVHTLHSRENWLKEGRCVMIGEEAYKMVKSRKKWRETKPNPDALDLELFGSWQTEKYIPTPAVDGKITRNVYGNIELFKPWMLPAGTVHLQGFPALNRIAKKLDMDCVPAMVGWDSHGGFPHPLIDGWVVCEEQKDILIAAWDEEQEIQKEREIERREKRVYGNWKLLTRSLLIRERLKKKFDLKDGEVEEEDEVNEEATEKGKKEKGKWKGKGKGGKGQGKGEKATDVEQSWPQNRKPKNKKALHHSTEIETL